MGKTKSVLVGALLALAGCSTDTDPNAGPSRADLVVKTYATVTYKQYSDAVDGAVQLQAAIAAFLGDPTEARLATARQTWTAARRSYMPTEARRGWNGPIDHANAGPGDPLPDGPEVFINSWPLDEAYLDYTDDGSGTGTVVLGGLVYDDTTMPDITYEALRDANGVGGDGNISTGYHAIEFLLWGQDLDPNGPGHRPASDYQLVVTAQHPVTRVAPVRLAAAGRPTLSTDGLGFAGVGAVPRAVDAAGAVVRRREILAILAQMLVDDLSAVRDQWAPGSGWYQAWMKQPAKEGLTLMVAGCSFLAKDELTNARIQVAFDLAIDPAVASIDPGPGGSQEEEHSCFSDTTHLDIYDDVRAMDTALTAVWTPGFGAANGQSAEATGGQSLFGLLAVLDPQIAGRLRHDLDAALAATRAMRDSGEPFDRQILAANPTGRARVQHAIDTLNTLATTLDSVGGALGLTVTFVPDND